MSCAWRRFSTRNSRNRGRGAVRGAERIARSEKSSCYEDRTQRRCAVSETSVRDTWREADEQLCRLVRERGALDAEEAKWLVIARREHVHLQFGYGSFREYVERRLGYQPHTAID